MGANAQMAGMGAGCDAETRSFSTIACHMPTPRGRNPDIVPFLFTLLS